MKKHDDDQLPEAFERFVEFENRRYEYGGQVPLLQYASRRKPSKKIRRDRQRILLAFVSIVLLFLAFVFHQVFLYFLLALVGIWSLYALVTKLNDRREHNRGKGAHDQAI